MEYSQEISTCLENYEAGKVPAKEIERAAVQHVLAILKQKAPGKSVELRIPPYAAIQIIEGPNHRRGTPAAVVEMSARALITLACGTISWEAARRNGTVTASGQRSDLSHLFPC